MKKFLSLPSLVAILLFAIFAATPNITQASPYVTVKITGTWLNQADDTLHLYTTLTNTGNQDARVYKLNIKYFKLFDASGKQISSFQNATITREPCYVKAGYHVNDVEWVIHFNNGVPNYNGPTKTEWDSYVEYYIN